MTMYRQRPGQANGNLGEAYGIFYIDVGYLVCVAGYVLQFFELGRVSVHCS